MAELFLVRPQHDPYHSEGNMKTKPRIFVSVPDDRHLDDRRKALKRAIIRFIAEQEFDVVGFEPEQFGAGLAMNLETWTVEKADRLIRRCDGVVGVGYLREFGGDTHQARLGAVGTGPAPHADQTGHGHPQQNELRKSL